MVFSFKCFTFCCIIVIHWKFIPQNWFQFENKFASTNKNEIHFAIRVCTPHSIECKILLRCHNWFGTSSETSPLSIWVILTLTYVARFRITRHFSRCPTFKLERWRKSEKCLSKMSLIVAKGQHRHKIDGF